MVIADRYYQFIVIGQALKALLLFFSRRVGIQADVQVVYTRPAAARHHHGTGERLLESHASQMYLGKLKIWPVPTLRPMMPFAVGMTVFAYLTVKIVDSMETCKLSVCAL